MIAANYLNRYDQISNQSARDGNDTITRQEKENIYNTETSYVKYEYILI